MSKASRHAAPAPAAVPVAVVIPTRNRAALASTAVRSLIERPGCPLQVFVSDNSTSEEETRRLAEFCRGLGDPSVVYLRPPEPLPMPEHWEWAIGQALARSDAEHLAVHYDRRITKPGHLAFAARVAARRPDAVVTYTLDMVVDDPPPIYLYQTPWTGEVYEMRTERVVELTARGMVSDMGQAFPIMSNCLIPRRVLEEIRARFGSVCTSTGPDSCFTYRFCALNESYLHLDRALGIVYASHRSNGLGYMRGKTDGDFGDFLKSWGDRPWLDAAPIPGLNLGQNMLYHEYVLVRREAGGDRFPPIDTEGYLGDLAQGLIPIRDPQLKEEMRAILREHGWRGEANDAVPTQNAAEATPPPPRRPLSERLTPRRLLASAKARAQNRWSRLMDRPAFALFAADYLPVKPPHLHGFTFASNEQALRYALICPRRREALNPYIQALEPSEFDPAPTESSARS